MIETSPRLTLVGANKPFKVLHFSSIRNEIGLSSPNPSPSLPCIRILNQALKPLKFLTRVSPLHTNYSHNVVPVRGRRPVNIYYRGRRRKEREEDKRLIRAPALLKGRGLGRRAELWGHTQGWRLSSSLQRPCEEVPYSPISQMRNPRHRQVKQLPECPPDREFQNRDIN